MPPPEKKTDINGSEKKLPVIKDDYGYVVNPYVPKFISKTPWYADAAKVLNNSKIHKPVFLKKQIDLKKDLRTYDEKHDRWNNFENKDWTPKTVKPCNSSDLYSANESVCLDPYSRTCSRNLRLREDVAKYLDKSNSEITETYDPKSRGIGIRDKVTKNKNSHNFAWDESRTINKLNQEKDSKEDSTSKRTFKKDDRRYKY